jgi:PIN domain nuclease of toxin-antitoxin system
VRLLLDTQIVLWQQEGRLNRLRGVRDTIEAADELLVSVISFAEIGIKAAVGKLTIPENLQEHVRDSGARVLGLAPEHGLGVGALPLHHRDPFDRLLISQALCENLAIVTSDPYFADYGVTVINAA